MREALGKSAVVVDKSMLAVQDDDSDASPTIESAAETIPGQAGKGQRVGDKAFDDETDLKNEDFIFVY
jgi:hypothetical protein